MKTAEQLFLARDEKGFRDAAESAETLVGKMIKHPAAHDYSQSVTEELFSTLDMTLESKLFDLFVNYGSAMLKVGFQAGHDAAMKEVARAELEQETV